MHICMCNCYGYTHVILYQYIGLYYNFHNTTTDKVLYVALYSSVAVWSKPGQNAGNALPISN